MPPAPFMLETHADTGRGEPGPMLVWRLGSPVRAISSAILGGGIRTIEWVLNAHVRSDYGRMDPEQHLRSIASGAGLDAASGTGLLTAARVESVATAFSSPSGNSRSTPDTEVRCDATVGVSYPTWAAAPPAEPTPAQPWRPGTINLVCQIPAPLTDSALVGAVLTATEAKTQALIEGGLPGTGTASDAIVICCPVSAVAASEPFAGPRSPWGAALARAVHQATAAGLADYVARHD